MCSLFFLRLDFDIIRVSEPDKPRERGKEYKYLLQVLVDIYLFPELSDFERCTCVRALVWSEGVLTVVV